MKITVGEVKKLLDEGKIVKVKTLNNEYTRIVNYIDKGLLDTFKVSLENGYTIKVSKEHKFFTDVGWLEVKDIKPTVNSILCDDNNYYKISSIDLIGKYKIVDIEVEHKDHCYFGNGMLNHNTGKSLLCAHILANTQKKDGVAVFIDTESATSPIFFSAIGVDLKKMLYIPMETVEDIFQAVENMIETVRKSSKNKLLTIIVDSLAGASTKVEMEADYDQAGYATQKAIILSKAMRKITGLIAKERICLILTNQLRSKMNAPAFSDPWTTSGGKAVAFHSSVRIRLAAAGQIKDKTKESIGVLCKAKVVKNRVGPPMRSAEFEIYFDSGIDDKGSLIKTLKLRDVVKTSGASYTFIDETTGEEIKFTAKSFVQLITDRPDIYEKMYKKLCDVSIMQYKDNKNVIRLDEEDTLIDPSLEGLG